MCYFRIGTFEGNKIQATPTKQDLGTFNGFFSNFLTSTRILLDGSPPESERSECKT